MNLDEARALAEELMGQHGLLENGWTFEFGRAIRRAGSCRFLRRVGRGMYVCKGVISLSRSITELNDHDFVKDTLLHEIAHALAGPGHHHDAVWKEIAQRIGCNGRRCHKGLVKVTTYKIHADQVCLQSHDVRRSCDTCGTPANVVHMPERSRNSYCQKCCPACNPPADPPRAA
jgi:predicted SprT family Zn-dependent metalloprotease